MNYGIISAKWVMKNHKALKKYNLLWRIKNKIVIIIY